MIDRHPGPMISVMLTIAFIASGAPSPCQQLPAPAPTAPAQAAPVPLQDQLSQHEKKLSQARAAHDSKAEVFELDLLGALLAKQQPQKALDYLNQAMALAKAANDRSAVALTFDLTGRAYAALGQKQTALDDYSQALLLDTELNDRKSQAKTIGDRGLVYFSMGERDRALGDFSQALSIFREIGDTVDQATLLNNLGVLYYSLGEAEKALDYFNQALPKLRSLHSPTVATALGGMGLASSQLGRREEALGYLNEALAVAQADGDHNGEATQLNNLAVVYAALGQKTKSLDYLVQATTVLRSWGTASILATALNNLANAYADQGDDEKALSVFHEALAKQSTLNEPLRDASTMCGLARISLHSHDPRIALQYYSQAIPLFRKVGDREDETGSLALLGMAYELLGQNQNALSMELAALSIAKSLGDPDLEGGVENTLMRYFRRHRRPEEAIFFGLEAVNSFQQLRGNLSKLDKSVQKSFTESKSSTYRMLAELLVQNDQLAKAEDVLDLLKEQELKEVVRGAAESPSAKLQPVALDAVHLKGLADLAAPEKNAISLTDLSLEYTALQAKSPHTPEEDARLKLLDGQIEARNAEVSAFFRNTLYPELARQGGTVDANTLLSKQRSDISLLQNTLGELGPRVLGIRILLGEQHAYAILVSANTRQKIVLHATPAELRAKALQVRDDLRSPASEPKPHLAELYAMIVTPLDSELKALETLPPSTPDGPPVPTILWSLDGVLRYVPMAALYDGSHYMAERFNNVLFTPESFGHMTNRARPDDAHPRVLAMGLSKSYGGLPALPGVMPELEAVVHDPGDPASHGPMEGRLLSNEQFTLEALKTQLGSGSSYPVVHIASHFVVQTGVGHEEPFLLLGSEGSTAAVSGSTQPSGRGETVGPAQTSGYQLTLSKIEDSSISFRGTHLLTLSACNTASGAAMKDGLEMDSLGMIAQQKDAEAVLATLWSVNDMSTSRLMSDFYSRWVRSPAAGKAEALRQAQLAFLNGLSSSPETSTLKADVKKSANPDDRATAAALTHPFYWAPFVLIGNFQ